MRFRAAAVAAATAIHFGCYSYTPVETANVAPNNGTMRVHLTDSGAAAIAPYVGPYAGAIDGRLTERNDSLLILSVQQLIRRNGVEETWRGETVRVPRAGVASVEREQLSRSRSWLLAGGIVLSAAALGVIIGNADGLFTGRGGPGSGGAK